MRCVSFCILATSTLVLLAVSTVPTTNAAVIPSAGLQRYLLRRDSDEGIVGRIATSELKSAWDNVETDPDLVPSKTEVKAYADSPSPSSKFSDPGDADGTGPNTTPTPSSTQYSSSTSTASSTTSSASATETSTPTPSNESKSNSASESSSTTTTTTSTATSSSSSSPTSTESTTSASSTATGSSSSSSSPTPTATNHSTILDLILKQPPQQILKNKSANSHNAEMTAVSAPTPKPTHTDTSSSESPKPTEHATAKMDEARSIDDMPIPENILNDDIMTAIIGTKPKSANTEDKASYSKSNSTDTAAPSPTSSATVTATESPSSTSSPAAEQTKSNDKSEGNSKSDKLVRRSLETPRYIADDSSYTEECARFGICDSKPTEKYYVKQWTQSPTLDMAESNNANDLNINETVSDS
ncbi:hypothetical protein BDF19DRAFT_446036 [Syncephalis fuscata]|nr:hypothetical protein BDF19DRAFT_446036 [Syncephalis fuscata]